MVNAQSQDCALTQDHVPAQVNSGKETISDEHLNQSLHIYSTSYRITTLF